MDIGALGALASDLWVGVVCNNSLPTHGLDSLVLPHLCLSSKKPFSAQPNINIPELHQAYHQQANRYSHHT